MSWRSVSILEVKVRDETNKVIYKSKVNSSDVKRLSLILGSLESTGIKISEAFKMMIESEEEDSSWFN